MTEQKERRIYTNPTTGEVTIVSGFESDTLQDLQKSHKEVQERLIEKFNLNKKEKNNGCD